MKSFTPGQLGGGLSLVFVGIGLLIVGIGYNGAAGNLDLRAQFPYLLSGGILGLCFVVFGTGLMINHSAREDRQRLETVLLQLLDATEAAPGATAGRAPSNVQGLFAAGSSSFHRADCRLVDGREEVTYVTAAEAASRELKACRVCQPESSTNVTVR